MNKEEMRFKAAAMAMQGLIGACHTNFECMKMLCEEADAIGVPRDKAIVKASIEYADALLSALYPSTEEPSPVPDADGWIEHRPGDAMPCDPDLKVDVRFIDGVEDNANTAGFWRGATGASSFWNESGDETIIAWRPAK